MALATASVMADLSESVSIPFFIKFWRAALLFKKWFFKSFSKF